MVMRVDGGGSVAQTYNPPEQQTNTVQTNAQEGPATPQTPAERTDAAYAAYQQALANREKALENALPNAYERGQTRVDEDAKVAKAKQDLDAAIRDEIAAKIDRANTGIPPQYQRPVKDLIDAYGNEIVQRHANDPAAQTVLKESIEGYKLQRQADQLIPSFHGNFSPQEKLASLGQSLQGQPPEVVEQVMNDPRVQQWVKDAAAHIGEPYKDVGNVADAQAAAMESSERLAQTVKGLPPELAAEVIEQSMPTIEKIAGLSPHLYTGHFLNVYSAMSQLGNTPEAQALMSQAAGAFARNDAVWNSPSYLGPEAAIQEGVTASNNPAFALELANQLRANGKGNIAENVTDQAARGVTADLKYNENGPKAQFDKAHQASVEKDQRLAELLANAGPLTPEQTAAFIKAYREDPENAKVYKAEADAAQRLADHLEANKESLLFAAGRDPQAAQELYDSLKALKDAGQGRVALEYALSIQKDPNSAVAQAFNKFSDFKTDFTQEAIAAASAQLLADNDGNASLAFEDLKAMFDQYGPDWAAGGVLNFKDGIEAVRLAANGDFDRLNQLAANFEKSGPVIKGLAAAGIIFGAATGTAAAKDGEYAKAVNNFAMAGNGSARLLASVSKNLADAGKLASYGDTALTFAKFSSKLAPGLAIVANSAAAVSDGGKLFGGDLRYTVSFIGDVVAVLGGALEFTPLAPAGLLLQGVGALIQIAGSIITGGGEEQDAFRAEQQKYLEAAGITNADTRAALVGSDQEQVKHLLALGLKPEQIQDLATNYPGLLESHHGGAPFLGDLPNMQKRTGLTGDQLYQMIKAADANGEPGRGAAELLRVLGSPNFFPEVAHAQSKADLIAALETQARNSDGDQARALNQAAQWLKSH